MNASAPEEVPAEAAGDEGAPATPEEAAKEAKEEVKEKKTNRCRCHQGGQGSS